MADLLTFPESADGDLLIEPDPNPSVEPELELELEPGVDLAIEPDRTAYVEVARTLVSTALVEILPADFPLPLLARFVPNVALRTAIQDAARDALSIEVVGAEGLQRADLALAALRASIKAAAEHFEEPAQIANDLHKRITGIRADWQADGKAAVETVGRRIFTEQQRLDALAAEQKRRDQAEADRKAREDAQREADAAARSNAPAEVVEELKRQAETVTAPPVATPTIAPPALKNSSTVKMWKSRLSGTPGSDDPHPEMATLTALQRVRVMEAMKAVLDGRAPMTVFDINWKYLDQRAKADKSTFTIPGFEAFEEGSVRGKATRTR